MKNLKELNLLIEEMLDNTKVNFNDTYLVEFNFNPYVVIKSVLIEVEPLLLNLEHFSNANISTADLIKLIYLESIERFEYLDASINILENSVEEVFSDIVKKVLYEHFDSLINRIKTYKENKNKIMTNLDILGKQFVVIIVKKKLLPFYEVSYSTYDNLEDSILQKLSFKKFIQEFSKQERILLGNILSIDEDIDLIFFYNKNMRNIDNLFDNKLLPYMLREELLFKKDLDKLKK